MQVVHKGRNNTRFGHLLFFIVFAHDLAPLIQRTKIQACVVHTYCLPYGLYSKCQPLQLENVQHFGVAKHRDDQAKLANANLCTWNESG